MSDAIEVPPRISIPRDELAITYVRSSGPGGQHLNKVSTKAVVRWNVARSRSLPADVKQRFLVRYQRRLTAGGELVLTSQRFRERGRNLTDCLEKLRDLLRAVAVPPKRRIKTRPSAAANQRRLIAKQKLAEKKSRRRQRPRLDD